MRRQQFAKEVNRGAEEVTAGSGEFFAAGASFGGGSGHGGEFALAAEAFIGRGFGAGAKQDLEPAAEFFDTAEEVHLINVAFGVQRGEG